MGCGGGGGLPVGQPKKKGYVSFLKIKIKENRGRGSMIAFFWRKEKREKRGWEDGKEGTKEAYDGADGVFVIWVPSNGHYHWVYVSAFLECRGADGIVVVLVIVLGLVSVLDLCVCCTVIFANSQCSVPSCFGNKSATDPLSLRRQELHLRPHLLFCHLQSSSPYHQCSLLRTRNIPRSLRSRARRHSDLKSECWLLGYLAGLEVLVS